MTTEIRQITVSGIRVDVVRKDIKNLHLGVYPPHGRVRVAAPLVVSDEAVRLAVIDKLAWIKRQKAKFADQPRQSRREMVNGESHYFLGRRYRLRLHDCTGRPNIAVHGISSLDLFVPPGTAADRREAILLRWYRQQLKKLISPLLEMGAHPRRSGSRLGHQADEDQVGQLQPRLTAAMVQSRAG